MDILELRTVVAELEDGAPVEDIPIRSVAEVLSSEDRERCRMGAYAIRLAAEKNAGAVVPCSRSVLLELPARDPSVWSNLIRTVGLLKDRVPDVLEKASGAVIEGLSAADAEVRLQSAIAIMALAGTSPTLVTENVDALLDRLDDPNPRIRAIVFETLAKLTSEDEQAATEAVPRAADATTAGNARVRTNALHFLAEAAESDPSSVAPYVDEVQTGLSDPASLARSNAAYAMSHVGKVDPEGVAPYLDNLVDLLSDPEETARGNSSSALIEVGNELPKRLPTERTGERLAALLDTPIVSVQENAVYLTALVVQHDRKAIVDPGVVKDRIRELRSDSVVDVPDDIFDWILSALDTVGGASCGRVSDDPEQTRDDTNPGRERSDADQGNSPERRRGDRGGKTGSYSTEIFNTSSTVSCPGCGTDLTAFNNPAFCPECGKGL